MERLDHGANHSFRIRKLSEQRHDFLHLARVMNPNEFGTSQYSQIADHHITKQEEAWIQLDATATRAG